MKFAILLALALTKLTIQASDWSIILGRPTDHSIALSVLAPSNALAHVDFGKGTENLDSKTPSKALRSGEPIEFELESLSENSCYHYRLVADGETLPAGTFQTQRAPGASFTFALQGDSHPERAGKMFHTRLYQTTMQNVAKESPDFYVMLGDDFSIERLLEQNTLSQANVDQVYARQRDFLRLIGSDTSVFLVNGNHEQAGRFRLDGSATNCAVLAALARSRFYPLPAPDGFYTGDTEMVPHIGLLHDYYAWTWGDALFVVIDPYWHSSIGVDEKVPGQKRDLWKATLGDTQYQWLTKTLTESKARWKFVFAHHVMGTGRGGIEGAQFYEWGGKDQRGDYLFPTKRPGWPLPIHNLFVKAGVTIFFQGHDHLFVRQELDGVVYQSCPNPADNTYQAFNRDAYRSGEILPNSGHLLVSVSSTNVKVDYVRSFLPGDKGTNAAVAFSYTIPK